MESPKMTQILVSQNVPYNSPMEVTINDPVDNHIHCSQVLGLSYSWIQYFQSVFQSASKGSPMTVTINGDNVEETNQIEVAQNAADDESTLTCVPDCPQEDYVYDYQVRSFCARIQLQFPINRNSRIISFAGTPNGGAHPHLKIQGVSY